MNPLLNYAISFFVGLAVCAIFGVTMMAALFVALAVRRVIFRIRHGGHRMELHE